MIHTQETARIVGYEDLQRYAYTLWQIRERIRQAEGQPEPDPETAQQRAIEDWHTARERLRFG